MLVLRDIFRGEIKIVFKAQTKNLKRLLGFGAPRLSGLPNANAKSQRFSHANSQIATLSPVVALNRNSKSQIAARYVHFGTQLPKSHWPLSFSAPKSQRFKSQRLQDANATKSQTLAFCKSQRFSATKLPDFQSRGPKIIWQNTYPTFFKYYIHILNLLNYVTLQQLPGIN